MNTKRTLVIQVLVVAALVAASMSARAERSERHGKAGHGGDRGGWRGDIRHFERKDIHTWRAGHWRHARHGGRLGWWWVAAGTWYFYPQPVYPYPDPYIPPVVVMQPDPASVPQPVAPAAQPAAQNWYYCKASEAYYPYVSSCPSGWKIVPATPPDVPAQ